MELLQLDPDLKSLRSPEAWLYIENGSERTVDVFWIDYNSTLIKLATLKVDHNLQMNSSNSNIDFSP